jgi:hypothetical protein
MAQTEEQKGKAVARRDTILIEGRAYSWRQLRELRRQQIEASRSAQAEQLILFELKADSRPTVERSASARYEQPTLLDLMGPAARTPR